MEIGMFFLHSAKCFSECVPFSGIIVDVFYRLCITIPLDGLMLFSSPLRHFASGKACARIPIQFIYVLTLQNAIKHAEIENVP